MVDNPIRQDTWEQEPGILAYSGLDQCHFRRRSPVGARPSASRDGPVRQEGPPHWTGEKLVLTELEGRFRDACFCWARWNEVASERSLSPPCEGGGGGGGAGSLEIETDSSRLARG